MKENAGKVAKRKGLNSVKHSITKMDIKTEMRTTLYLQNKIKFKLFMHHQYQDQVDHMKYFLCIAAFSNPETKTKRNRNKDHTMNIQMEKIFITNGSFVS